MSEQYHTPDEMKSDGLFREGVYLLIAYLSYISVPIIGVKYTQYMLNSQFEPQIVFLILGWLILFFVANSVVTVALTRKEQQ